MGVPAPPSSKGGPPLAVPVLRVRRVRGTGMLLGAAVALVGALSLSPENRVTAGALLLAGLMLTGTAIDGIGGAQPGEGPTPLHTLVRLGALGILLLGGGALLAQLVGLLGSTSTLGLGGAPSGFSFSMTLSTSVAQAACLVLIGTALLVIDLPRERRPHLAEWLAGATSVLAAFALVLCLFTVSSSVRTRLFGLSPSTALSLFALTIGVICARPERGIAAVAASTSSGGTLLRWLVPTTLALPVLVIAMLVRLPDAGGLEAKLGAALVTLLGGTAMVALEAKLAFRVAASESERQANQQSLRRALGDLAQALRDRDRVRRDYERSNRDLDEFAYAASHDLRAPLRGIANLANWLEEDLGSNLPASARQQIEMLRGRIHRMESLIDGILKHSRAGRAQEPLTLVSVDELLRETIELVSPPPGAQITIGRGMPQLETERAQLQQVFLNLISNAIKHARRSDAVVEISAEDLGDHLRFVVADNGPGIAPQYQERIWGMFQTLESRDQVEGTGIGLATVKKLVERRGGRVGVESEEGKGARFFFLWPRYNGDR